LLVFSTEGLNNPCVANDKKENFADILL